MKMQTQILTTALALVVFASCKKESTASSSTSTFEFQVKTINRTAVVARVGNSQRTTGANIQWTAGTAAANELKFEATGAGGEVEFKQRTAQQIDLFNPTSTLGNLSIPAGTYSEVEFKAFLSPSGATPALELNGSFTTGNTTRAVKFLVATNVELKAEKNNVTVAQGATYSALNTLDLSQLTKGISESALAGAALTNGVIVLSATSNSALYNEILNNLNSHHGEAEVEHEHD